MARAEPVSFEAHADRTELAIDETLRVEVVLISADPIDHIELGDTTQFQVVSQGQSRDAQVSLGGGGGVLIQQRYVFTLTLRPTRQGALTVPPASAVVRGKKFTTRPIAVKVGPPGSGKPARPGPAPAPAPGPRGYAYRGWEKDVTLELQLDRREAWMGEQVTASLWLVSGVAVVGYDRLTPPRYDGFWVEELDTPRRLQPEVREVNGVPLRAYLVQRLALFPTRAGELTLAPAVLDGITVQVSDTSAFDPFPELHRLARRTAAVTLEVKPLPPGAPAGFDPVNVGVLKLEATAPALAAAGDPVPVRLTASGDGNVPALALPRLPAVDGARAFQPTTHDEPSRRGARLGGSRTVETVLVPERTGTLELPGLEWPYFDPKSGSYQVARTPPLRVEVTAARAGVAAGAAGTNTLAAGLRPIRSGGTLARRAPPPWEQPLFGALLGGPPALFLLAWAVGRARALRPAARVAGRAAGQRLAQARRRLARGDRDGFLAEVERALVGYAGQRLGRPAAGLTREALAAALTRAGAHPPAVRALSAALDAVELSRYGAGAARGEEVLQAAQRALELLEEADWRPGEVAP
ncbi:MAG: BatD family protein [Anaeromyxobacter sp.]